MARSGVLAPLFDRIVDSQSQVHASPFLDEKALRESILRELSIMLNTRCTVSRVTYAQYVDIIPVYGMPDLLGLPDLNGEDPTNPQAWPAIESRIETTIQAVEPRVRNVRVKVLRFDGVNQELVVDIGAQTVSQNKILNISFPLAISQR